MGTFARTEPPDDLITRAASIRPFTTNRPVPDAVSQFFYQRKSLTSRLTTIYSQVDWRNSPCLPPIEFQGSCGCCWAFAATSIIIYSFFIHSDTNCKFESLLKKLR